MIRFCYLDCTRNSDGCYRWWKEQEVQVGRKGKGSDTRATIWQNAWNGQFDQLDIFELTKRMEAADMCDVPVYEVFNDAGEKGEDVYERRATHMGEVVERN